MRMWILGLAVALCAGCGGVQSWADPAGRQAGMIDELWRLTLTLGGAVYVLVMIVLFWGVLRRTPDTIEEGRSSRKASIWISLAVVVSVLILGIVLVKTYVVGRDLSVIGDQKTLTIKIKGHQWWWEVEYDSPVAQDIFKTANEIHIPVGEVVEFKLSSSDVIHSFWVPNLHGKKDLIPGYDTVTFIKADKPGTYRGQCAEFCGYQHAHMSFYVVAQPKAEFQAWAAAQRQPAQAPSGETAQRGAGIFVSTQCALCHSIRGTDAAGQEAPDLTHLASRLSIGAGLLPMNRGNLAGWIADSQSMKPGNHMPTNVLAPQDLQALVAYLEELK